MTVKPRRISQIGAYLIVVALMPGRCIAQSGNAPAGPEYWVYTVRPGDTLWALGRVHLIRPDNWPQLQRLNRLTSDRLIPGTRLRIPFDLMRLRPAPARIRETRGGAQVIRADGQRASLARDRLVYAGDVIETGADGSASVIFADESTMLIGTNTRVAFDRLANFGATGMVDTRLRLDRGRVRPGITPRRGRFQIWSPALQVATRGTEFRVGAADDGTSRVEVTESEVEASAAGATVLVAQGAGTLARPGGQPAAPVSLLAPPALGPAMPPLRRLPFRLTIPPVAGATGYHWEVAADMTFQSLVLDVTSDQPAVPLPDLSDGTYVFRVRAVDGVGLEGLDATGRIQIDARPEPPFLMAPVAAALVRAQRPSLSWAQPANAVAFRVQISQDSDFETVLVDDSATPGHAYVPDSPLAPGTYLWRVATRLADGEEGPFGDPQTFTIRRPPGAPTTEPPAMGSGSVVLRWSASGGTGIRYHAQLARDGDFATIESEHTVSEPQLTLPRPAPGTYYLRVRAIEADDFEGAFGPTQAFAVAPPEPTAPPARRRWWLWLVPPVAIAGMATLLL